MKTMTFEPSIRLGDRTLRINTGERQQLGCFVQILARINSSLEAMLSRYCKIYVVQFVFHPDQPVGNNALISDLMRVICKQLERAYRSKLAYGWVRETGQNGNPHYHIVLILNANKVRHQYGIRERVCRIIETRDHPRPAFNTKSHLIHRHDDETYQQAFHHLSYLAKTSTKGQKPKTANEYSFSRLKALAP